MSAYDSSKRRYQLQIEENGRKPICNTR